MNEFRELENIFTSFLGEPKSEMTPNGQLQYNCPCCAEESGVESDGKYNLEVNLKIGKFHCWKCGMTHGMKGGLSFLIKRYGNPLLLRNYKDTLKALQDSGLYDLHNFSGDTEVVNTETFVALPKTFRKINFNYNRKGKMVEYLKKRKITQEIIDKYNIGYTNWDEEKYSLRNRIIFPSYDSNGFLNYWVGRDFTGKEKRVKYINADVNKTNIVCFENLVEWDADIVLTEGIFDALNVPNAIPLLGKVLKPEDKLYQKLYANANANIIIAIDADTEIEEVKKIYKVLNRGRLKGKIYYVRPQKGKDFGEIFENFGKKGVVEELKNKKNFKEIELV